MTARRPATNAAPTAEPGAGRTRVASGVAGLLIGFNLLGQAVALSGLLFAGTLAAGAALNTALLVGCCAVATGALMVQREMPRLAVGALQTVPVAALLPSAAVLAAGGLPGAPLGPEAAVATMLALLGAAAVTTGATMLVLSALDLGRMVRLMPHPVASGFLASAGMILILAALGRVAGPDLPAVAAPGDPAAVIAALAGVAPDRWTGLALALGLAMVMAALARWRADLGPVLGLGLALGGFYGLLAWQGLSIPQARALGYLPDLVTPADAVRWHPDLVARVDWALVWDSASLILVAAMIGVLGTMLNLTGIELALRREIDTRRALTVTGLSNIGLGLLGGSISYASSANTVSAHLLGARGPLARWIVLATLLAGLVSARQIVALTPTFVASGLLIYIGYTILDRWLLDRRRYQTRADWSISAAIVGVSAVFGILPAIGLGIVAASLIFAVSYARLPVVTRLRDLNGRRSTVDRGPARGGILDAEAHKVLTLSLRGFLFFGSVEQVLDHVRAGLARPNRPETLILDFRRVSALDGAAMAALQKLATLAEATSTAIVIAEARAEVVDALARIDLPPGADGWVSLAPTTDAALEAAEDRILARHPPTITEDTAREALIRALQDAGLADRLLALMRREELDSGATLIARGDSGQDIFMVDRGRLAVMAALPDGQRMRVRSLRPGAIVGEIASYAGLPRTADVVAETPATVYRFTPEAHVATFADAPDLAAAWHKMIAITLSEKIHRATLMLQESG